MKATVTPQEALALIEQDIRHLEACQRSRLRWWRWAIPMQLLAALSNLVLAAWWIWRIVREVDPPLWYVPMAVMTLFVGYQGVHNIYAELADAWATRGILRKLHRVRKEIREALQ